MALVERYINTASTAGGDGTTNDTTPSNPNRAYASAIEWEAAEGTDLTASGDIHLVHCSGATDDTYLVLDGFTTNASCFVMIVGDNDTGIWDDSKYSLDCTSYSTGISITIADVEIDNVQLDISYRRGFSPNCSGGAEIHGCIIRNNSSYSNGHAIRVYGGVAKAWNNIVYGDAYDPVFYFITDSTGTLYAANNTLVAGGSYSGNGLYNSGTMYIDNNILFGVPWTFSLDGGSDNGYTEASDPGTSGLDLSGYSLTDIFNDPSNEDYSLKSGSPVIGEAHSMVSDSNVPFSDDAAGVTRSSWDIGAFEYVTAGSVHEASFTVASSGGSGIGIKAPASVELNLDGSTSLAVVSPVAHEFDIGTDVARIDQRTASNKAAISSAGMMQLSIPASYEVALNGSGSVRIAMPASLDLVIDLDAVLSGNDGMVHSAVLVLGASGGGVRTDLRSGQGKINIESGSSLESIIPASHVAAIDNSASFQGRIPAGVSIQVSHEMVRQVVAEISMQIGLALGASIDQGILYGEILQLISSITRVLDNASVVTLTVEASSPITILIQEDSPI